ncbi:hypothetical protein BDD43_0242 [Mucilaginibacter gracilis]|uniref:Uncharacterized protein n=1 Tax=Mucilaginibacter gracilis TaxID=423350 RepID=A0A495ITQ6_9SPHI|nr:hypothetical protein [Mucilaginibacter gracilis]RKR80147.1 hypothetical protein BDD43_0242 [Mucilaginibacter gracilis]
MENSDRNINDEILDRIVIQVEGLSKQLANLSDYTKQFETLSKNFDRFLQQYQNDHHELKNNISQFKSGNNHDKQIQTALVETKSILEDIRKMLPLKLINTFDHKTKGFIISGIILLIVVALSTGLSCHLWKENNKLEAVDIKYRLAKHVGTTITNWVDSIYLHNPEEAKRILAKMEANWLTKDEHPKTKLNHGNNQRKKRNI